MELKENNLIIFRNEKKEGKQPDYSGEVNISGEIKNIALWVKEAKNGKKYFSGQISERIKKDDPATENPPDADLPF